MQFRIMQRRWVVLHRPKQFFVDEVQGVVVFDELTSIGHKDLAAEPEPDLWLDLLAHDPWTTEGLERWLGDLGYPRIAATVQLQESFFRGPPLSDYPGPHQKVAHQWWSLEDEADVTVEPVEWFHFVPVDRCRVEAAVLRSVVETYRAVASGNDLIDAWGWLVSPPDEPSEVTRVEGRLAQIFSNLMTELCSVGPVVGLDVRQFPSFPPAPLVVGLGQVVAMQVRDAIEGEKPLHECAECGAVFSVQRRGRARAGQHRTSGVKYCSTTCSNRRQQREYRRRQAAKRAAAKVAGAG